MIVNIFIYFLVNKTHYNKLNIKTIENKENLLINSLNLTNTNKFEKQKNKNNSNSNSKNIKK